MKVTQLRWLNHSIAHVVAKFVRWWLHSFALFRSALIHPHYLCLFSFFCSVFLSLLLNRVSMNTCCFPASILICNIENGITQKWTLHHKYPFVCLSTAWCVSASARGTHFHFQYYHSDQIYSMETLLLYTLKIAFNTWSLKHSLTYIICRIIFACTLWFICDLRNSMSTIYSSEYSLIYVI